MTLETLKQAVNIQRAIDEYRPELSEPENDLAQKIATQIINNSGFFFCTESQIDDMSVKCLQLIQDFRSSCDANIESLRAELAAL